MRIGLDNHGQMSPAMRFSTMWYVQPAKPQISQPEQSDLSLCESLEYSMTVRLLTKQYFEFLSLTGGCTGLSESIHVKMPHCWKSRRGSNHSTGLIIMLFDKCLFMLYILARWICNPASVECKYFQELNIKIRPTKIVHT